MGMIVFIMGATPYLLTILVAVKPVFYIKRPLCDVPKCLRNIIILRNMIILTCIQRLPLCKGYYEVALVWLLNTFHCTVKILPYNVYQY